MIKSGRLVDGAGVAEALLPDRTFPCPRQLASHNKSMTQIPSVTFQTIRFLSTMFYDDMTHLFLFLPYHYIAFYDFRKRSSSLYPRST